MNRSTCLPDDSAGSKSRVIARIFSVPATRIIKTLLYLCLTYIALFVGVSECQGQSGCWGNYYERVWNCDRPLPAHKEYCTTDRSDCSNCPSVPSCASYGSYSLITNCTYVPWTCPDSLSVSDSISYVACGVEGWCRGGATLTLTAVDGAGHTVTIFGTIGGNSFNCGTGTNPCYINLPEGSGNISYQAQCSGGLVTNPPGTDSWKLDLGAPVVSYTLTGGVLGAGGWYLSGPVTMNCVASDGLSGIPAGGISYGSQTANGDGVATLSCTASDKAGNTSTAYATVSIDGTAPVITPAVSGGVMGAGGWYLSGPVSLVCQATDATSGVGGISYGAMTATDAGTTSLNCTAVDNAGNSSSYSTSISIDNIPPGGEFIVAGDYCNGGWYNSPVRISLLASDTHSGPAGGSFQVDGVSWTSDKPVADGVHTLTGVVYDVAGNSAPVSLVIQVDTTPPTSTWSVEDGKWIGGQTVLEGTSTDVLAGIALVEVSVDNGATWVEVGNSSSWTFTWDTLSPRIDDGSYELLVRARDKACNQEHTGRVTVNVDNTAPDLSLKDNINLMGRTTTVIAADAGSGVDHGLVTISGNGIEPRQISFTSSQAEISWDGMTGDGKKAPFGVYQIHVDVWDKVGNHSETEGTWVRPAPKPEPTQPSGPMDNTNTSGDNGTLIKNDLSEVRTTELRTTFWRITVWPAITLSFLLLGIGVAKIRDRRPGELHLLGDTLKTLQNRVRE
jgi:hypothetical protein